ncbi:MAG: prepilin-type N-terminal cleavage/methylation domain-containing protein [Desulfobacterales bacterium]|jgi:type IV pilus assembly protein PilV|nr:prepilin-type N-terminal cleavage/methylation domain-containing protein [Desulfobacterales bacterium]MDD4464223.1 prepilin-type N-terminal cleavage/methylation domain-containing protein [Desulfobacterales bacterium]
MTDSTRCIQTQSGEGGFTLVEVLIAMVVAAIGFLGLAMMQVTAIQANSHASKYTQASILAQERIEELNSEYLDPDDSTNNDLKIGSTGTDTDIDETGAPGGVFTRTWTVSDHGDFTRAVTVVVTWNGLGLNRTVRLSTITMGRGDQ